LRRLVAYDPDQIQALYATPHAWTPFARQAAQRRVIQTDLSRWDYKHQVLESERVPNWRVLCWVKLIEAVAQLRPKSLLRLLFHPEGGYRAAMRWYYGIGRRVWPYELWHWLFHDRRTARGPTVAEFWDGAWLAGGASARARSPEREIRRPLRPMPGARWGGDAGSSPWPAPPLLLSSPRMDPRPLVAASTGADQPCRI
jgi:anaerobic magnesium-protoporphyrin IX monomethyl ester cyclase